MKDEFDFTADEQACKRLLKAIFSETEEIEAVEMTNLFRVTDKLKFYNIVEHIMNENGVHVIDRGDKVGLYANDTICSAAPLNVEKEELKGYTGEIVNTLKLLQEILPEGEFIVLQGTCYTVGKDDIQSSVLKVTNKEIKTL